MTFNYNLSGGVTVTFPAKLESALEDWLKAQTARAVTQTETLARIEQKLDAAYTQGAALMQAITDFAAKVNQNFASIKGGIQALDDKITAFQNSPGTLSAADQAALDDIVATSATLAAQAQTVVPPVPAA